MSRTLSMLVDDRPLKVSNGLIGCSTGRQKSKQHEVLKHCALLLASKSFLWSTAPVAGSFGEK